MNKYAVRDVFDVLLFDLQGSMEDLIHRNARYIYQHPSMYELTPEQTKLLETIVRDPKPFITWATSGVNKPTQEYMTLHLMQEYMSKASLKVDQ